MHQYWRSCSLPCVFFVAVLFLHESTTASRRMTRAIKIGTPTATTIIIPSLDSPRELVVSVVEGEHVGWTTT